MPVLNPNAGPPVGKVPVSRAEFASLRSELEAFRTQQRTHEELVLKKWRDVVGEVAETSLRRDLEALEDET